jgi:hypothetical protein
VGLLALTARDGRAAGGDVRAVEARKHCAAGRVEEGIELLARIVGETGDPHAVYNQARCYQQNGRAAEALERFKEYRRTRTDLTPRERAEVEGHIRELEAALEHARPANPPAPSTGLPSLAVAPAAPAEPSLPRASLVPQQRSRLARSAVIGLAAAGVAGIAGGAFFGWQERRTQIEVESQQGLVPNAVFQERIERGRRAEVLQWLGYGVGAAALIGSAAVHLFSRPRAAESTVTAAVVASPGGAGLLVRGHF